MAIQEDLSALIDEELAPRREAEVRAHLETCDRCARRLEELCNVDLVLARLPAPEVAPELRAQLAERIAEHERGAAPSAAPARREAVLRGARRESAFARLRSAARWPRGLAPPPSKRRWLGSRVAALAALAAAVALVLLTTLRGDEPLAPGAPQIARPAPQTQVTPGPEPQREPLLAGRPGVEPEPALAERVPAVQPEAARVEIAETPRAPSEAAPGEIAEVTPPAPEAARSEIAEAPPAAAVDLENVSEEDLEMLLELDAVEDLDVIANLELLEDLLAFEAMEGAG